MKKLRILLYPFSLIYGFVTAIRNFLYDKDFFKSERFDLPVICVGNLNTGGTGKSPMIEYLIRILSPTLKVAVLSRGYRRKTNNFIEVETENLVEEVGDEPLQFKTKFPEITVAVDANRVEGIKKLKSGADVILLDDAFQHRKVEVSLTILLTAFNDLYAHDFVLPAGNLREVRSGSKRADIVVVTKCKLDISKNEMVKITNKLNLQSHQTLFFSGISYDQFAYSTNTIKDLKEFLGQEIAVVTGIANSKPFVRLLTEKGVKFEHLSFPDHHNFTENELKNLSKEKTILTTEKDYMRLKNNLKHENLYFLPIKTVILDNKNIELENIILKHIQNF